MTPDAYQHHRAFDEVAETLGAAFAALGGSAPIARRAEGLAARTPIVFGAHLLRRTAVLPADAILFNEQVDAQSARALEAYRARLARHAVLDCSIPNTRALKAAGLTQARHFPIRSMPNLSRIEPSRHRDIDVLFYGSMNERRAAILEGLRVRGLNVVQLFGSYGAERDAAIARAKIVVNIHFYASAIFESVRISHLLANGACVVSEGQAEDPDCADLAGGLHLCPHDAVRRPSRRARKPTS